MPNIGPMEVIIVLAIALLILGPKKLPDMGRSLGKGMREFKDSISGDGKDDAEPATLAAAPTEPAPAPRTVREPVSHS